MSNIKKIVSIASFLIVVSIFVAAFGSVGSDKKNSEVETPSASMTDSGYKKTNITLSGKVFNALVSDTMALREQGLSGRASLDADQAMLFVFDRPDLVGFWMKDMKFSIDMLWVDKNLKVVSFQTDVSPDTYPKTFYPRDLSKYVIEFPAGTLSALAVKEGDTVSIPLP